MGRKYRMDMGYVALWQNGCVLCVYIEEDERKGRRWRWGLIGDRSVPRGYASFQSGESIGEGTFGKVRLGVHLHSGVKVAVKTLQKEKIVEQADIERVTREICILKILRHPNIIQLYEVTPSPRRSSRLKLTSISSWNMPREASSSTISSKASDCPRRRR